MLPNEALEDCEHIYILLILDRFAQSILCNSMVNHCELRLKEKWFFFAVEDSMNIRWCMIILSILIPISNVNGNVANVRIWM